MWSPNISLKGTSITAHCPLCFDLLRKPGEPEVVSPTKYHTMCSVFRCFHLFLCYEAIIINIDSDNWLNMAVAWTSILMSKALVWLVMVAQHALAIQENSMKLLLRLLQQTVITCCCSSHQCSQILLVCNGIINQYGRGITQGIWWVTFLFITEAISKFSKYILPLHF